MVPQTKNTEITFDDHFFNSSISVSNSKSSLKAGEALQMMPDFKP